MVGKSESWNFLTPFYYMINSTLATGSLFYKTSVLLYLCIYRISPNKSSRNYTKQGYKTDREPLFCTQFAKQKICPILYITDCVLEMFNPFQNKSWFLPVCSANLLKTQWEKKNLLVTSNFSFSHLVF